MNKNTETIVKGMGDVQNMNDAAKQSIEKTKKEFKKEERVSGYKPPKYEEDEDLIKRKDGSSEGDKTTTKITQGHGYIKDFEAWVRSKESQTKKDNK